MKAITKGMAEAFCSANADHGKLDRLVLSIEDTRAVLGGVSRQTVYNFINEGKITTAKIGARRLVVFESIKAFVAANIDLKTVA